MKIYIINSPNYCFFRTTNKKQWLELKKILRKIDISFTSTVAEK